MHLHNSRHIKCAGVAGSRARALSLNLKKWPQSLYEGGNMQTQGKCQDCTTAIAERNLPVTTEEIGESVLIEIVVGRGRDRSQHTFRQCATCGSLWMTIREGGVGGHGTFHHCLTAEYF